MLSRGTRDWLDALAEEGLCVAEAQECLTLAAELAAARERLEMLSHRAEWVHPEDHLRVVNRAQKAEAALAKGGARP